MYNGYINVYELSIIKKGAIIILNKLDYFIKLKIKIY